MNKIWLVALLCVLLPSAPVLASTVVRTGDSVTVSEDQSVTGSFYALGGAIALSGEITGDAVLLGGNVTVNGPVTDDLFILGGNASLHASITEDVRIIAGDVTISEPIGGSLVVIGGRLTVLSTASIAGDVLFYGEEGTIDGAVGGQIMGNVRNLRVNSKVGGIDVTARSLTLGERADVTGDVQYASQNELVRSPDAVVTGEVIKGAAATTVAEDSANSLRQLAIVFLISLFATLSLYLMARRFVDMVALSATESVGLKFLAGFGVMMVLPISIVILLISMLGILVGMIGLAVLFVLVVLSLALMNVVVGTLVSRLVTKGGVVSVPYIILGAVLLQIALFIPVVGPVVIMAVFLATAGTLTIQLYHYLMVRS